jgi:quercetin dioxygenase-like cupin family protein
MYTINSTIKEQSFNKLQVVNLGRTEGFEILSVSLEKAAIFPKHTSPTDAQLVVLEGDILFHIEEKSFHLSKFQHFSFPKEMVHWVQATENSKFIIVR